MNCLSDKVDRRISRQRLVEAVAQLVKMPFYQFNKFTGRLKESTHPQPFYPISPNPLQSVDPPTMIYDTIKTKPAKTAMGVARYSTNNDKFLETCKKLQADLEYPVYKALGKKDKILFGVTTALLVFSTFASFYQVTQKKKS